MKSGSGVIDGVVLSQLAPGVTYDLAPAIAECLITAGTAVHVRSTDPAIVVPLEPVSADHLVGRVTVSQQVERVDDRHPRIRLARKRS